MEYKFIKEPLKYDGSQIEPMWALSTYNIKGSSIVAWSGPMNIRKEEIIDFEDVDLDIKGDKLLHFIIEHFDCQPADLRLTYHRQRIFVTIIQDVLREAGMETQRQGDDIFFEGGKLSVSIATCSISSLKIHFALNITCQGTPEDVYTSSLEEGIDNIDDEKIIEIAKKAYQNYRNEIKTIEYDIAKTRVF